MPFTPRIVTETVYQDYVRTLIKKGEGGPLYEVTEVGDHTATIGWGYTFVRKGSETSWGVVGSVIADMLAIGINWSDSMRKAAKKIADALNNKDALGKPAPNIA